MRPPSEGELAGRSMPPEQQPPITPPLRVSDQERDETVQRLQTAFAEGRLTDEEFDQRMHATLNARTQAELEQLLADLPVSTTPLTAGVRPARARRVGHLILAVMGNAARRGRWRLPEQCTAVALMGGCVLDLRAAQRSAPVTTINAVAIMGSIKVIVPPGVRVEMHGLSLMGDWSNTVREADLPPDAPEVRVRGFALMGSVAVRTRKPRHKN